MRIVPDQRLILGPPGCGKTTESLNIVERELADGVAPDRIAYISFTKKAVEEAISRALTRFNYKPEDLPWFRTLHSLAYRLLGLRRTDVMSQTHFDQLGQSLGYTFNVKSMNPEDGFPLDANAGSKLLFIDGLARNRCVSLEEQWHAVNDQDVDLFALQRLHTSLRTYKDFHNLLDYTDMLEQVVLEKQQLHVDVVVIDEAQDLSRLQWAACRLLFRDAKRVYIAGDDDQAVYKWSGADVAQFLALEGDRRVLGKSYRLPRSVHRLACGVIQRVDNRFEKNWVARDEEGIVEHLPHIDSVNLDGEGTTMILARNAYLLNDTESTLRKSGKIYTTRYGTSSVSADHYMAIRTWERLRKGATASGAEVGVVYSHLRVGTGLARGFKGDNALDPEAHYALPELCAHHGLLADGIWHDALDGIALNTREYYLTALRAGGKLNETPKIRISTIHAAKGGEADNVVLLTEMSQRTYRGYQAQSDDEHRVFYVGMTRAKRRLTLVDPRNNMGFVI
jgi:DNA helicase-2/ATP-dependent DNA helicase PcrA